MSKKILKISICIFLLTVLLYGCGASTPKEEEVFEVKRGDMDITVTTDGSLSMPNVYNLRFGTMGTVKEILVQEGDKVKQGAILAFLDNTSQKNSIKNALLNFRTAVNNIGVNTGIQILSNNPEENTNLLIIDKSSCNPFYSSTYPDLSAPMMIDEAEKDLNQSIEFFKKGLYKDAGIKLGITYFDIEVCEDIIKTKPDASVLAGAKQVTVYTPDGTAGTITDVLENYTRATDYLQKYRKRLMNISSLMMQGNYQEVSRELTIAQQDLITARTLVENTVTLKGWDYITYPNIPASLNFVQSALRSLQDIENYMLQSDAKPDEIAKKLYLAKLNLSTGRDILENKTLTYFWGKGFTFKDLQQYNLAVQSAEIALYKAKNDIMNTVIIAPTDGTVVSVNLKKDYVLSAQDYSARTAIQLVDTSKVQFNGLVDEIDIMKVKTGQKATITVDAIPDKKFSGTVKFISPFGEKSGQVIKFAITIELDPTDVELRGGLTATANISVYSAKNILLVPVSVVISTPRGTIVNVLNTATGKGEPRIITIGNKSFQYAEVLQGLKEGDRVMAPDFTKTGGTAPPTTTRGTMRMITR